MHFGDIVTLEQAGLTTQIQQGFNRHKKDEYCDQRATGAAAAAGVRNVPLRRLQVRLGTVDWRWSVVMASAAHTMNFAVIDQVPPCEIGK